MKLKSNLEVVILWYFANFDKECALADMLGDDYILPFSSGFFDDKILETIIELENAKVLSQVVVSFPNEGLILGPFSKDFKQVLKKAKLPVEVKKRFLDNKFYLKDIALLESKNLVYESDMPFFDEIIYLDLSKWKYPKSYNTEGAKKELNKYKDILRSKHTIIGTIANIDEVQELETYLNSINLCKSAYERYCKNCQLPLKYNEEFELSEQDLEYYIDQQIVMAAVLLSEDLNQIRIRRLFLTYNRYHRRPIFTNVVGSFVNEGDKNLTNPKLYKIYCSKKDKLGNFYIIINDLHSQKIKLAYKHAYAKLLYEVIHGDVYNHNSKIGIDELIRRACGLEKGKKATHTKTFPNIKFVNFLERKGTKVFSNGEVELVPERS